MHLFLWKQKYNNHTKCACCEMRKLISCSPFLLWQSTVVNWIYGLKNLVSYQDRTYRDHLGCWCCLCSGTMVARKGRESSSRGRGWEQPLGGWSCVCLAVHHSSGVALMV